MPRSAVGPSPHPAIVAAHQKAAGDALQRAQQWPQHEYRCTLPYRCTCWQPGVLMRSDLLVHCSNGKCLLCGCHWKLCELRVHGRQPSTARNVERGRAKAIGEQPRGCDVKE